MEEAQAGNGWRGSTDVWLEAAYESFLDGGIDAVRIQPLAKKLSLSRTSFYWFFKDREELLSALIARWREKNTGNLVGKSEAYAETIVEAMLNVFDCWLDTELFDAQFEFSIRSWAVQSPDVLSEVRMADKVRLEALARMFLRFGFDEAAADVRARSTYLVQIGYISMQSREDTGVRLGRIPNYVEILTSRIPSRSDLDRFYSRHREQG
jgi:AcrR family transcriptional regulator